MLRGSEKKIYYHYTILSANIANHLLGDIALYLVNVYVKISIGAGGTSRISQRALMAYRRIELF